MSARPRVLVLEPIDESGLELLRRDAEVTVLTGPTDPRLDANLATADALVVRSTQVGADLLDRAPRLRVIGRHGAGLDNIDSAHAAALGITVVNTPRSNTESVAEYVIAAALLLTKQILPASAALRSGAFTPGRSLPGQVVASGHVGGELAGRRLGLVGLGAIGRSVAGKALALGMRVAAVDPFVDATVMRDLGVTRCATIAELLPRTDVLSLHVPGGGDEPLVGAAELALLPGGAVLVNSARAGVVDTGALVEAVTRGHLGGAAVDVFDPEPPPPDSPLLHTPGILCTPHMAAMTHEALVRMARDVATNVLAALRQPRD